MELQFKINFEQIQQLADEDGWVEPITDKTTWTSTNHPFNISVGSFANEVWRVAVCSDLDLHWINREFDTAAEAKLWCNVNLSFENLARLAVKSEKFRHAFVDQKKVA